ncbi:MAG: glycoside hydrolase family 3 C-terminal domain-containing protein [Clostridiales Family XIII bacterium]|jgi:beta-glucosidase-like glycosyl hydrolase/regulation of enolase protein 1 (concanavalin A-like superfamily)|nr:glycoside hydrolase family 3 C-terminal domain-containing protein [Clostridiales Family XIII bacterium]
MLKVSVKRVFVAIMTIALVVTYIPLSPVSVASYADDETSLPIYQDKDNYSFAERAASLVAEMTVAEKAYQVVGSWSAAVPRLGIAQYQWWNEALHGYSRGNGGAATGANPPTVLYGTQYPQSNAMASTWDPELYYIEASQIGDEARERVVDNNINLTMYSPTINLQRDPRWGRNEESYSEDPYLTGVMGSAFVKGMEGKDFTTGELLDPDGYKKVISTIKHYTANNSESNRRGGGANDIDFRALREYYTAPYRNIIKDADVTSVMTAYSEVNEVPASSSSYLMDTLLRQMWGFSGYITSDCDSVQQINQLGYVDPHSGKTLSNTTPEMYANALAHGEDLECNAGYRAVGADYRNYMPAVLSNDITTDKGKFTENQLDVSVHRLMTTRMELGEFDGANAYRTAGAEGLAAGEAGAYLKGLPGQTAERLEIAKKGAESAVVMLQNDEVGGTKALPIKIADSYTATNPFKIVIVGYWARGGVYLGTYSSTQTLNGADNSNFVTIERGIIEAFAEYGDRVQISYERGFTGTNNALAQLTTVDPNAVAAAAAADLAIVVAGTEGATSAEDRDRATIALPGAQAQLIAAVGAVSPKTVAVLETCGPVQVTTFENNVDAILWSGFGGLKKGVGFGNVITGKVNPSGKTTALWHNSVADNGASDIAGKLVYGLYKSDNNPGRTYMYFDGDVSYPFGYGLSYTTFEYSDLTLDKGAYVADDTISVSFKVKNTGSVAGAEVAQLYVSQPNAPAELNRPIKRLVGFDKVELGAGAETTVTLDVAVKDLAFFDPDANKYVVDQGAYRIEAASSSASTALTKDVNITGTITPTPEVVTFKPNQTGDEANAIAERLIFNKGVEVFPHIAVAMNDESLYGRTIKDNVPVEGLMGVPEITDIPLPAGAQVSYTSNRPEVVSVDNSNPTAPVITTNRSGVATITATVNYNGESATNEFVVYVKTDIVVDGISIDGTPLEGFTPSVTEYEVTVPYGTTAAPIVSITENPDPALSAAVTQAAAVPGYASIVVTDTDANSSRTYYVSFNVAPISDPFADDFASGGTVSDRWRVHNATADASLAAGGLAIKTARGSITAFGGEYDPPNVYLQSAGGDWVVRTHINFDSTPNASNQQAGLIIYGDSNNFLRYVYERPTTGNTNTFRAYNAANNVSTQLFTANSANQTNVYLQITKTGKLYTFAYSTNGTTWTTQGSTELSYLLPEIGVWASNGNANATSKNVTFEYFKAYDIADSAPTLDEITIDGAPITGFSPTESRYVFDAADYEETPVIGASSDKYQVDIVQPDGLPGFATITVSSEIATAVYYVSFEEDFTPATFVFGEVDDKWKILNENADTWEVVKGLGLKLPTQRYDINGAASAAWENIFVRPGGGEWEVIGKFYFPVRPNATYQQVGMLAFQDENNYVKIDLERGGSNIIVQVGAEINGTFTGSSTQNVTPANNQPLVVYFKLTRSGDSYRGAYSFNGVDFTNVGNLVTVALVNPQIGVMATRNSTSDEIVAYCEYVDMTWFGGVLQKDEAEILADAFNNVVSSVVDSIPETVTEDVDIQVPYGYVFDIASDDPDALSFVRDPDDAGKGALKINMSAVSKEVELTLSISDGGTNEIGQIVTATVPHYGTELKANPATRISMKARGTYQLEPITDGYKYEYSASNPSVVKVDANGLLTAVRAGTATVSVRLKDGSDLLASVMVTVVP